MNDTVHIWDKSIIGTCGGRFFVDGVAAVSGHLESLIVIDVGYRTFQRGGNMSYFCFIVITKLHFQTARHHITLLLDFTSAFEVHGIPTLISLVVLCTLNQCTVVGINLNLGDDGTRENNQV